MTVTSRVNNQRFAFLHDP